MPDTLAPLAPSLSAAVGSSIPWRVAAGLVLASTLATFAGTWTTYRVGAGEMEATHTAAVVAAWQAHNADLMHEVGDLRGEVRLLRHERFDLYARLDTLMSEVRRLKANCL